MKQKLTLRGDWPSSNATIAAAKKHWSHYAREKKRWTDRVWAESKAAGLRPMTPPIRLHFIWHMPSLKRDPDNLRGITAKYVIDGLVKANVIPDDGPKQISGFRDDFVLDRKSPRIEITLEEE